MAGAWKHEQSVCTKSVEYLDGAAVERRSKPWVYDNKSFCTRGIVKDAKGGIWDRLGGGYWTEDQYVQETGYSFVLNTAVGDDASSDLYGESVQFLVDKETNRIRSVQQRKTWEKVTQIAPNLIKVECIHTVFDMNGRPRTTAWNSHIEKKINTLDSYEKNISADDLSDFVIFLKNTGNDDLLPLGRLKSSKLK